MDDQLHALMASQFPKINPDIANGLATVHMKHVERYVDDVMRSASQGFPEGLRYLGCQKCTPIEEFNIVTKPKNNKRSFSVSRSDLYLMKYFFELHGQPMEPRYLYLPYVGEGGTITMGGSRYVVSPVLTDKVISIGLNNVFVRLLRDKVTFERVAHGVMFDFNREIVKIPWSLIYHSKAKAKVKTIVKAKCSLLHFMLCKYGFTKTFEKFAGISVKIGRTEINPETYPEKDWVIVSSTGLKPKTAGKGFYDPSTIRLAIRRQEFTPLVKTMVSNFIYIVDHFPSRIEPEWVDDTRWWCILMGHILFGPAYGEAKLYDDVSNHIRSLDEYIDGLVRIKLKDIGHNVEDIYDLFAIVMKNMDTWLVTAADKVSSMYDKELSILYHILECINNSIFRLNFKLKVTAKRQLTEKEVTNVFNSILSTGKIYDITKQHVSMSNIDYSGDNKVFKMTSLLVPQATGSRNRKVKKVRTSVVDPVNRFHVSIAEVGGYACLPKSDPTGHARINMFVKTDEKGNIVRDPSKVQLLDNIQEMIKR